MLFEKKMADSGEARIACLIRDRLYWTHLRGAAGGYQAKNVRDAMMLNIGGSATARYVFVIGAE